MARRRTRKVNLRSAYRMSGWTTGYAWFIREKVIPIIGSKALHPIKTKEGSREREWACTARNFQRVVRAYDLDKKKDEAVEAVEKVIESVSKEDLAKLILNLSQPKADDEWPVAFKLPIHPMSHNAQYAAVRSRLVSTDQHNRYKRNFERAITTILPDLSGVDWSKPTEVDLYFGHRESSDRGFKFDRPNFQKAAIDELYRYIGRDDSLVRKVSIDGEFVDTYEDGFIQFKVRNV